MARYGVSPRTQLFGPLNDLVLQSIPPVALTAYARIRARLPAHMRVKLPEITNRAALYAWADDFARGFLRNLRPVWISPQHLRDRVARRPATKWLLTSQALEQTTAECPDVRPLVHLLPARLLWAHVGQRAYNHARIGC